MDKMDEEPVVVGDWVRECILGEGGFGVVAMWKNPQTGESITVKKCRWGLESNLNQKQRERWINEVEVMQKLNHPNIVKHQKLPELLKTKLLEHNPSGLPLLSMEYCTKGDLRKLLLQAENCCGLPELDVRYIMSDLIGGVSYLHQNSITHRDIKPENVVLQITEDRPTNIIYKIIDLGYAKEIGAKTTCASFVGTLHYLAPEIFYGNAYSNSVDYWSLGIVAFEIICGVRPVPANMSPAQWLLQVEKKQSNDICIYETAQGDIKFSEEVFAENHLSSYFKREMEKWLRLTLCVDPRKRGYRTTNIERKTLDIFTDMKNLLKKKCVTLFSTYTNEFLSYEIDDSTLFSTLQVWYERDTKVPICDQIWLTQKCEEIVPGDEVFAIRCYDATYPNAMVFVFKKQEPIAEKSYEPQKPRLLNLIFESNHTPQHFYQLKQCFAHILYFVYKQQNNYNTLLIAWKTMIHHLCYNSKEIGIMCRSIEDDLRTLKVLEEFSENCLIFDSKQYADKIRNCKFTNDNEDVIKQWQKSSDDIKKLLVQMENAIKHIMKRYESNNRRALDLSTIFQDRYSPSNEHDLNCIFEKTLDSYKAAVKKIRDKMFSSSCRDLKNNFIECLTRCESMLAEIDLKVNLSHILKINEEQQIIRKIVDNCLVQMSKIKEKLNETHIGRQKQIWGYVGALQQSEELQNNATTMQNGELKQTDKDGLLKEENSPISNNQIVYENVNYQANKTSECLLDKKSTSCENLKANARSDNTAYYSLPPASNAEQIFYSPATDLIDENVTLRYEMQSKTNESFQQVKNIMNETLDFNFLQ